MYGEVIAYALAATALLGSPGPGIAALVAVGCGFDLRSALRLFGMLQLGLAIAAGSASLVWRASFRRRRHCERC